MNLENQQRVVGVVILVAFIALLIPFLFTSGVKTKQPATDAGNEIFPGEVVTNDMPSAKDEFVKPLEYTVGNEMASHTSSSDAVTDTANPTDNSNVEHTTNITNTPFLTANDTTVQNIDAVENRMIKSPSSIAPAVVTPTITKPVPVVAKKITPTFKSKVAKPNKVLWSVQVGSFAEESRAKQMVAQLQAKKFRVYMQKITNSHGTMVRVLVGRKASKPEATKLAQRLQKELGITGYVVGGDK